MTKSKSQMTKEFRMTKDKKGFGLFRASNFVIRASFVICHSLFGFISSFVIRHSVFDNDRLLQ